MILKGNLHAHGMKLIGYMLSAEKGEAAEFVAIRGFDYFHHDPEVAADIMQGMAAENSKSPKPFFHGHLRTDPHERLSDAQWMQAIDRMERQAGFSGQPRFVTQHLNPKTGERHFHVAWFRFDSERGGVIDPGLFKNKFKQEARKIEKDFALRELSNDRRPHDLARAGTRNELEEARRLGTDVKAIRSGILDCFEKSDNGRSFAAAIRAHGMELVNGDRRDCFVVVDQAGGQHALNKKLTGMTLAEIRSRLADLDRTQLPSVDQAQEMQRARQAVRDAARAAEQVKDGRAADGQGRDDRPTSGPQSAPSAFAKATADRQPEIKPLGKTAGEIRLAWQTTKTPDQFAQALEDRGLILVHVSREEAEKSWRAAAFHKAIGRQSRTLREGFAVVDQRGNVTRIDQRTTGDHLEEIKKRIDRIDKDQLVSVDEAKETQREVNRAEWLEKKQAERAQERIKEPVTGARAEIRAAWTQSRDPGSSPGQALDQTRSDGARLEEALAVRGFAIARVTPNEAYQSERTSAFAKEIDNRAPVLKEGEIVAVNGFGSVYRLDERSTGQLRGEIDARLAGIDVLPSVTEAKQQQREASRTEWIEQRRDDEDKARPATAIEQKIIDCRETARLSGAQIGQGEEWKTVRGPEAFAARLEQAGLAIVRVTASDIEALAELRAEENLAREIARTNGEAYRTQHFADRLEEGDIAAVTRQGDVYELNSHRLDLAGIAASLESPFRDGAIADVAPLPSITDARVAFLIERNAEAALREEARDEAHEARLDRNAAWDAESETSHAVAEAERDTRDVTDAAEDMVDGAAAGIGRIVEKAIAGALNFLADMFAPAPPPTKEQAKHMREDAEFRRDLAAWAAEQAAEANRQDDARRKQRAAEREAEEEERARQYQRERERERDRS